MCSILIFYLLIIRRPPRSTRSDTLFPDATLFRSKTTFLHNPYVSDAMIARNPIRAAPATPLILSVGRLSRQKDYPTLLRAAAMLVHRPWRLRLCGVGPDRKALLALA